MAKFTLTVTTPEREVFNSEVDMVIVRTITGDLGVLAGHEDYVAPLDIGVIKIKDNEDTKLGAVSGGFIKIDKGGASVLCSTFEWEHEIDMDRAQKAEENARKRLAESKMSEKELDLLSAKLKRSLTRQSLSSK